ncbi:hypothetical protein [Gallibacterium sp. AGMB14963]|uniref:hypothetical protein n=1 Tax=Gallibacterium faecale TaxID=3019086 RepID=UPI0022F16284|nr:hypothetical protein [Gallibacterium sp. AGMB14963]MDA3979858.1 hypothetical protein [Gallibacterium sp. AGMB14963]
MSVVYGALSAEWDHFINLGLGNDLLPVVSDPNVSLSPRSTIKQIGKLPSRINSEGCVVGLTSWTNRKVSDSKIAYWKKDSRLGICIRTGNNLYVNMQKPLCVGLKNKQNLYAIDEKNKQK